MLCFSYPALTGDLNCDISSILTSMRDKNDSPEYICLIDENGQFLKQAEKEFCHLGEGLLHSAFLVMVFDANRELLLTRRSQQKKLWPGFWDGSVASHYHHNEDKQESVIKRLKFEIGLSVDQCEYLFKFQYHAKYKNIGSEYEICDVYRVNDTDADAVIPNSHEVSEIKFMDLQSLLAEIQTDSQEYSPWLALALDMYQQRKL